MNHKTKMRIRSIRGKPTSSRIKFLEKYKTFWRLLKNGKVLATDGVKKIHKLINDRRHGRSTSGFNISKIRSANSITDDIAKTRRTAIALSRQSRFLYWPDGPAVTVSGVSANLMMQKFASDKHRAAMPDPAKVLHGGISECDCCKSKPRTSIPQKPTAEEIKDIAKFIDKMSLNRRIAKLNILKRRADMGELQNINSTNYIGSNKERDQMFSSNIATTLTSEPSVSEDGIALTTNVSPDLQLPRYDKRNIEFDNDNYQPNVRDPGATYKPYPEIGDIIKKETDK